MQYDLSLVIGLLVWIFTIPAIVSAYSDSRWPRAAFFMLLVGGALVLYAVTGKPEGYQITDVPHAFVTVIGHYLW